ncbi:hypothetical protein DPMN_046109 [Dreissena polymorpha]|uniref:Uncharacterized protein n=1 Tax=Dreissena polymorpha TaxID=45954 RepID=A0A9D4D658_DREPO|nr:hypothetical protein DPMN_046109 [Dreissena polymorpha]
MSQGEKIVRPIQDSNPGHLAYRASALPTELTGPPHNFSPYVTQFRTCPGFESRTGRTIFSPCDILVPEPVTPRLQGERSPD